MLRDLRDDCSEYFDILSTFSVPFREFDEENETYANEPIIRMNAEKEVIMAILQSHGLKQTNLTSEFAREAIADEIMEAQREIWTEALSQAGIELQTKAEANSEHNDGWVKKHYQDKLDNHMD